MSEGICFLFFEIANPLQRFCSCGGPFLCLFSRIRRMSAGMLVILNMRTTSQWISALFLNDITVGILSVALFPLTSPQEY